MIELTEDDVMARLRDAREGKVDLDRTREELRAWRDRKLAAGEPLFPKAEARRMERDKRLRPLFDAGADGIADAGDSAFKAWLDSQSIDPEDRKKKAMSAANAAWLAAATNAKASKVAERYDALKAGLATEWNLPDQEDRTVYEAIRSKMKEHDARKEMAMGIGEDAIMHALRDVPLADGWKETSDGRKELLLPHGRDMFEIYRQNRERMEKDRPFLQQVRGLYQALTAGEEIGKGKTPPAMGDEQKAALMDWFAGLPVDRQDLAVNMLVTFGRLKNPGAGEGEALGGQMIEQLRRGSKDMVRWAEKGLAFAPKPGQGFLYEKLFFGDAREQAMSTLPTEEEASKDPEKAAYRKRVLDQWSKVDATEKKWTAAAKLSSALDQIDPATTISPWVPHRIERGLYDFSRSVPYTVSGFVPYVGIPAIFAATKGLRMEQYEADGISREMADVMSDASAALETPVEWLSNAMLLGKLPGLNKALRKLTKVDPVGGLGRVAGAAGLNVAGIWGQELLEENIQDAMPFVVQSVTNALRQDVPDVDWQKVLHGNAEQDGQDGLLTLARQDRLAFAVLPMALLGGAVATVQGFTEGKAANERRQALRALGLTDKEAETILKIKDPTERAKAAAARVFEIQEAEFRAAAPRVDPTGEMAMGDMEELEALAASRGEIPTIVRDKKGAFFVEMPDGTRVPAPTPASAWEILKNAETAQIEQQRQATAEAARVMEEEGIDALVEHFETIGSGGRTGNKINFSDAEPTARSQVESGKETREDMLQTIEMAGEDPTGRDLNEFRIFGVNEAEVRRMVWSDVSTLFRGYNLFDLVEENSHGWWKWARWKGTYTLDEAVDWLNYVGRETKDAYLPENLDSLSPAMRERAIDEALAKASVAWFTNKIRRSQFAPRSRVVKVLDLMAKYIQEILARAARLYKLDRDGKLEGRWKEYLAASVGLDDADIEARLMQQAQEEALQEALNPDDEISAALRKKLPHPDDVDRSSPMAGDYLTIADNFRKLIRRKDKRGKQMAIYGKEANDFFMTKGQGKGVKLDAVRQSLNDDHGFNFATVDEMLNALDSSLRGRPVYGVGELTPEMAMIRDNGFEFGVNYSLGLENRVRYTSPADEFPRSKARDQRAKQRRENFAPNSRGIPTNAGDLESSGGDRRNASALWEDFFAGKDKATLDAVAMLQLALRAQRDPVYAMDLLDHVIGFDDSNDMGFLDVMAISGGQPSPAGLKKLLAAATAAVRAGHVEADSSLEALNVLLNGGGFIMADEADGVLTYPDAERPRAQIMLFAADEIFNQTGDKQPVPDYKAEYFEREMLGLGWDEMGKEFVPVAVKLAPWARDKKAGKWAVFQNPAREFRIERIPAMKEAFDAWQDAGKVGQTSFSIDRPGNRENRPAIDTNAPGGAGNTGDAASPSSAVTPEMDAAYLDAVERGDMETAQRMVDNAAQGGIPDPSKIWLSDYKWAFLSGKRHRETNSSEFWSFYSKPLQLAYNKGRNVDFAVWENWTPSEIVVGWRYGKPRETGASFNAQAESGTSSPEPGISLMAIKGGAENPVSSLWGQSLSKGREKTWVYGWRLPETGGDNEVSIWVPGLPNNDAQTAQGRKNEGLPLPKHDPVAYDASGNIIPLSRRFNQSAPAGSGATFSIGRADRDLRRLVGAVEARMSDPQARAEAFTRLRTRLLAIEADFRIRAGRLGTDQSGPADYERENIARAGREVQAILGILPPEARYRVNVGGALGRVVDAKSDRGRVNALLRLIREVDDELEFHLREAYREDLGRLLKMAEAKRNDNRKISGKLGAETHDFFDRVNVAMGMAVEDAARETASLEDAMVNETDRDRQIDLAARLEIVATFGGLDNATTPATRLHHALRLAQEVYDSGRMAWLTIIQERADRVAAEARRIVGALGDPRVTLGTRSRSRIISWLNDMFWGEFVSIDQLMNRLTEVTGDPGGVFRGLSDRLRLAMNNYEDRRLRRNRELSALFRQVFGTTNSVQVAARLGALTDVKSRPGQITIRPARRVKQPPIPIERVPAILAGQLGAGMIDPATGKRISAPLFSRSDLDEIQLEYDRYLDEARKLRQAGNPVRRRVLQWSKLVPGQADDMDVSEMEAAYLLLLWRQKDYRPALRLHGVDETTIDEMEDFLSPEARQIMEWLGQRGEIEFAEIDGLHRRLFGVGLPKVENHFRGMFEHQTKDGGPNNPFGDSLNAEGSALGRAGFARHRVTHRSRPKFASALQVWQAHTAEVDWWLAHAEVLTEIGQIIRRPEVADALSASVGDKIAAAVRTRLQFLENGGAEQAGGMLLFEQVIGRMRAGASAALLGLKLMTLVVQSTAIFGSLASTRMTGAAWLRGVAGLLAHPSRFARMWQSATLRRRLEMGTSWEVRQTMQNANFRPSQFAEMARLGMVPITYHDAAFTSISAAIAYDHGLNQARRAGLEGDAAEASALEFMDAVVNETAQPVTSINRSTLENRWLTHPALWLAFAFATEMRQKLSMTIVAARKLATGSGPGDRGMALRITTALALMRAMEFGIRQIYQEMTKTEDDDDDRWQDPKAWIHAILAGHLGGIPVLGQMGDITLAAVLGQPHFSGSTPWMQGLGKIVSATGKLTGDEEMTPAETWEAMENILKAVGTLDARLAPLAQLVNLESAARGIWASATDPDDAELSALDAIEKEQKAAQKTRKLDLDKAEKDLRALPEGQRWKALAERHAEDPETMRELMSRLRSPALEPDEARLRKFAVTGGFRARAIAAAAKARGLEGDSLKAWLNQLRAKRVLTREVEADLQKALSNADN